MKELIFQSEEDLVESRYRTRQELFDIWSREFFDGAPPKNYQVFFDSSFSGLLEEITRYSLSKKAEFKVYIMLDKIGICGILQKRAEFHNIELTISPYCFRIDYYLISRVFSISYISILKPEEFDNE